MVGPNLEIVADPVQSMECPDCAKTVDVSACPPFSKVACPYCSAACRVPARLGSFLLLETLGRGGMGAVYKSQDITLNRLVAIKVLRKEYGDDQQFLASFLEEARAAAALNHRNVAQVYSFGQEKGQPYLVMELLETGRLDKMIEADELLTESFVMSMAVHIAEGLQAANEIGLTHGDIKPANILFNEKGVAKVVDFGLASFAKTQQAKPGEIWGTPYYIAPEKVRSKPSDHRADIYSLGGTLFHALAKTAPFEGETAKDVVKARLDAPAPSIREHRPDVTEETEAVIARMLERSTNRRYPTYASLLSDLHKADRAALKAARERIRAKAEAAAAEARAARRKPILIGIGVTLLLAAVVVGGWWWNEHNKPPERKIVQHLLVNGKLVPVYEDELEPDPPVTAPPRPAPADPPAEPASLNAAQRELRRAADALAKRQVSQADKILAAQIAELDPGDPARAQAQILQGVAAWLDGHPADAAGLDQAVSDEAPAALRQLAEFLSGSTDRAAVNAARKSWTPGPRVLSDLLFSLASLHKGRLDDGEAGLRRYHDASPNGWWTALQPLVPALQAQIADWRTLENSLSPNQPLDAQKQVQAFPLETFSPLRPVVGRKLAALQRDVRAYEQARQSDTDQKQQRDQERMDRALAAARNRAASGDYRAAAGILGEAVAEFELPEAGADLETQRMRYERMAEVRPFLAQQLTASPPAQRINALGGRISGATVEKIYMARMDGGGERSWDQVTPALYLSLLDFYIQKASLSNEDRAEIALSIACFWYAQNREPTAAKYARLANRLNNGLEEETARLLPRLDLTTTQ